MEQLESQLLLFIQNAYTFFQWPGVVMLMAIESACIPLPSEIIMPLSGWMLIKEQGLGVAYILVAGFYGALGCLIGSVAVYWLGAWGGRPIVKKYGRYVLISQHDLDLVERWFDRYGDRVIFFSRLLPVVRTFISLPAGVAKMHFPKFMLYTFLGSFPWCLGLAYGGYKLGEHWEQIRTVMRPFDIPIILGILFLIAFFIWRRLKGARGHEHPEL